MANLADYIDFSVQFDLTGEKPAVILTDTGNYPAGVPVDIKGNFLIIQPDGAQSGKLDFNNPNVKWDAVGSTLTPYSYSPRGACDGTIQNGTWQIKYTVMAAGYEDTVMEKSFYMNFTRPNAIIKPDFDVFTPSLFYRDKTEYTLAGYTPSIIRAWTVSAEDAGWNITSSNQDIDLKYNGKYYDSAYQATLNSTITYTSNAYSWLTIKSKVTASGTSYANTPPACSTLMDQLNNFATSITCGCGTDSSSDKSYVLASTMLRSINRSMADNNYDGLYDNIVRYEKLVLGSYVYTNTGGVISPFVYNCGDIVVINTSSGSVSFTEPIVFNVGDAGMPQSGDKIFTDVRLKNKIIQFFSKGNVMLSPKNGAYTYIPDNGDGTGKIVMGDDYAFYGTEDIIIGVLPGA